MMQHYLVQEVAGKDIAYEKIMAEPEVQLQILADALDVGGKVTSTACTCEHLCHRNMYSQM